MKSGIFRKFRRLIKVRVYPPFVRENAKIGKTKLGNVASGESNDLRVVSIVTIDDRGQMVLPKEVREKYGLKPGDKLAVVTRESGGRVCCIHMFKPEELLDTVREKVGTAPNE